MLDRAERRVQRHGYQIELVHLDVTENHLTEKFDLLVTRTMLMHVQPDKLDDAAYHISKMSCRLLLFEYWQQYVTKKLAWHNWRHDYLQVFTRLGYNLRDAYHRPDLPQILFHFER
jgi:hypothetical protein